MSTLNNILAAASIEELHQLRDIVLEADKLSTDDQIKRDYTNPAVDGPMLGREICKFGGNTLANIGRGGEGPRWREVVEDAADKTKADYRKGAIAAEMESAIVGKLAGDLWAKMSEAERQALIAEVKLTGKAWMSGGSAGAFQAAFQAGGFASYKILVIIVNGIVRQLIGAGLVTTGLSLATNAALTRIAGIVMGPLGWIVTGLLTAIQIAGPSYKVTVPCVIYVHYLRRKQAMVTCSNSECDARFDPGPKFCGECGAPVQGTE